MKTKLHMIQICLLAAMFLAASAQAQYTFGPEIQSIASANITYSSASGIFQYTDSANPGNDFAALPLAGSAASLITTSSNWTASVSADLAQRTMAATGPDELSVGMGLAIEINGSVNNLVYVALEQRNDTGVTNYNLYGNGVPFTALVNGQGVQTTPLDGSQLQHNGTSLLQLSSGTATGPATETNDAVSGVLTLSFSAATDTLTGYYDGTPVGSISLSNWGSNPSLALAVVGLSGGGVAVSAGTDTASNFSVGESLPQNPTVQFTADPTNGVAPLTVQFNSPNVDSLGNSIISWNWNFGDGATTNVQNPSHIYTNTGTFVPTLIATNSNGVAVIGHGPQITVSAPTASTNFTFTTNNGAITITGYLGIGYNVTVKIPSTINGYPVTSIGNEAFADHAGITNVTIPYSVTNIGDYAFARCFNLTDITVDINNSFYSSSNGVLFDKSQMSLFAYPAGLSGSYTIPISVTSIGDYAFAGCDYLPSVTLPSSVTNIGQEPFQLCSALTNIAVNTQNPNYSSANGVLFNKSQSTLIEFPAGLNGTYTISNSVTSIANDAFVFCSLNNVTIPSSVTNIGIYAFYSCHNLASVAIPGTVSDVAAQSFEFCFSLTNVTLGNGVTSIDWLAFDDCIKLPSVTISSSVTDIEAGAFGRCSSLTNINVNSSNPAYTSVDGVVFDKNQTTLVVFPAGNTTTSYSVPKNVTSIGYYAFTGCTGLTSVNIPSSVTSIADYAFLGCNNLTETYFQGSAPSADSTVFLGDAGIVYYLPGTIGWTNTFGGLPTALWYQSAPLILNSASGNTNFGVQNNQFGFTVSWATNLSVVIQAATNLANPIWTSLSTNAFTNGTFYFNDPKWTNYPGRFYRISAPQ